MKIAWSASVKVMLAGLLLFVVLAGQTVFAKEREVIVYVDNSRLAFEKQQPVIRSNTTLVPFRALFEALGFKVEWDANSKQAVGTKSDLQIALTIGQSSAEVNGVHVPLTVPAQIINGSTMIPLRFVSENSGYKVDYSTTQTAATIRISSPGSNVSASGIAPEPYVVKGRVVNAQGKPIKGALVTADNQLLYNSNAQAVTDADGYYRIPLGMAAATYTVFAEYSTVYNGDTYVIDLVPDNSSPFAANEGAIRHFKVALDNSGSSGGTGFVLFYMMDLIHPLDPIAVPPDRDHVILTMKPVGPQFNGSVGGEPFVGKGEVTNNGFGMNNVPLGRYEISASYAPPGEAPIPMLVRLVSRGQDKPFHPSIIAEFSPVMTKVYRVELELKLYVEKPEEEPWVWSWD